MIARQLHFARCRTVPPLLHLPLVGVNLYSQGRFVYCVVYPLLGKLHVGAVGFKSPRASYACLREHLAAVEHGRHENQLNVMEGALQVCMRPWQMLKFRMSSKSYYIQTTPERLAAVEYAFIRRPSPFSGLQCDRRIWRSRFLEQFSVCLAPLGIWWLYAVSCVLLFRRQRF